MMSTKKVLTDENRKGLEIRSSLSATPVHVSTRSSLPKTTKRLLVFVKKAKSLQKRSSSHSCSSGNNTPGMRHVCQLHSRECTSTGEAAVLRRLQNPRTFVPRIPCNAHMEGKGKAPRLQCSSSTFSSSLVGADAGALAGAEVGR